MQQLIKIKSPCEFKGVEYAGVAVAAGVNIDVGPACHEGLGQVVIFSRNTEEGGREAVPGPVLFVSALQSASIGCDVPPAFLAITPGDTDGE